VVLIEDQRIAFDEPVPLPRPRNRAHPDFAAFEARVLQRLLRPAPTGEPEAQDEAQEASRLRWAV
jgi:sulfonate transport system ATP-binding protein